MKTGLIALLFILTMGSRSLAQQMIPKQKGFEICYAVFPGSPAKQNYVLTAGFVSYKRNGNYLFGVGEYSSKNNEYENDDIPIDTFLLNGGYSYYVWGDSMRNVNVNLGISGLVGYEEVNRGDAILYDGSVLESTESFIYGVAGKLSFESYLTEHLVFMLNGQLRFLQNSQLGALQSLFGCGLRYNF
ncbi:conjugal transfer protein TraO [Chryseobacterium sp. 2TAF14]|uniref:conjugal transfer protein TraO n=1 Tax=Chryseobacterium sp. 2TAF14 TaxID=3233007 RepID=UPI003F8F0CBD